MALGAKQTGRHALGRQRPGRVRGWVGEAAPRLKAEGQEAEAMTAASPAAPSAGLVVPTPVSRERALPWEGFLRARLETHTPVAGWPPAPPSRSSLGHRLSSPLLRTFTFLMAETVAC